MSITRSFSGGPYDRQLAYSPAASEIYLGSPCLLKCSDGTWLASHDYGGPQAPDNGTANRLNAGRILRSTDGGDTWSEQAVTGMFWGRLFELNGIVYQLALACQFGSIRIRSSADFGATWSAWSVLFASAGEGATLTPPNWHTAPQPVLIKGGRIYIAVENRNYSTINWNSNNPATEAMLMHAAVGSDLSLAGSWTMSNGLPFTPAWQPTWVSGEASWIEGQAIEAPDGSIKIAMRCGGQYPAQNTIAIIDYDVATNTLSFNPATGFRALSGGHTKFTIIDDRAVSGYYAVIHNRVVDPSYSNNSQQPRHWLSCSRSTDLITWELVHDLVTETQPIGWLTSVQKTGHQYPYPVLDGNVMWVGIRTAMGDAPNLHDANKFTLIKRQAPWRN